MKYLFAISLCVISLFATAQKQLIDSLKQALHTTEDHSGRLQLLIEISRSYADNDPDSAMNYAENALALSQQFKDKKSESDCLSIIGNALVKLESYPKALETHFNALTISEDLKDEERIAKSYVNIARVYTVTKDYENAITQYYKAEAIFEKIIQQLEADTTNKSEHAKRLSENRARLSITLLNIGDTYERWGKLSLAMEFQKRANSLAEQVHDSTNISYTLINMGSLYLKFGNPAFALSHYKESLPFLMATGDDESLSAANHGLAEVYEKLGQMDSAIHFARLALYYAGKDDYKNERYKADTLLSRLFKSTRQVDSALHYNELATATLVVMNLERQSIEVQNLKSNEKFRQQEIAKKEEKEKQEREENLQMLVIAIFIITIIGALVILSRRKSKPRALKYMGVIGLLLSFEFITIFLHPYIVKVTNHTPVLILLISVLIASILAPLHHWASTWVKSELVQKRRGRPRKISNSG